MCSPQVLEIDILELIKGREKLTAAERKDGRLPAQACAFLYVCDSDF
jgi:hypothetical protein